MKDKKINEDKEIIGVMAGSGLIGVGTSIAMVSTTGAIGGLSAAGMTSGLATMGSVIGGGMAVGIAVAGIIPIATTVGGYCVWNHFKKKD